MTCSLCHGNHGAIVDGAHLLCKARAARGLATPCLGVTCSTCTGKGYIPATERVARGDRLPVYFNPRDLARGMAAMFPPCKACGGRGYTS